MGLSLLIGTNLFVSLLSCLNYVMRPNFNGITQPKTEGQQGHKAIPLNPEVENEKGRRSRGGSWGFRLQQGLSLVSLLLHNALVVSFTASGLSMKHTWRYPGPYE